MKKQLNPKKVTKISNELSGISKLKFNSIMSIVKAENKYSNVSKGNGCKEHWCTGGHCNNENC